ncbi:MAG TPA: glycosyltransferase [Terriglobales bacterium]|jgi:glycosyltransferase involved in cell wall biosynthesis|nr:glycosyltransferase [Terriglobales bacterium]
MITPRIVEPALPATIAVQDRTDDTAAAHPPGVFLMIQTLETGGTERQFYALAQSLDSASFRLNLGCIRRRGTFLEGLAEIPQFRLGGSLYGMQSLRTRFQLARHLRGTEIAIAHSFDFYSNLTLIPAARMAGVSVVIGSQRQLGDLLSWAQSRSQFAMFRWCDAVICNSQAAADRLISRGLPEHRVAVIGNGLPAIAFAKAEPALPRRSGLLRVGMIARMNAQYKNHLEFLRVATAIHNRFPDVEFVLVGDGPLRPELEHRAQSLGLGKQAVFLGDRRDILAILASLDISVLPSSSESMSNVVMESMAAGLPVVATNVGGNPELINKHTGILVSPHDQDGLMGAIERLLRDANQRAALGQNAQQYARQNFALEQMQRRHEELYSELLERKHWKPKPLHRRVRPIAGKPLQVAIIAASLRYVGGQSVQADLLLRNWQDDPEVQARFIPIDPQFPHGLRWIERVPLLRTVARSPLYAWSLWQGLKDADVVHIFSASYWSFLVAPTPAWLAAVLRRKKTLIHYHSGEARDHLRRFRSARPILAKADILVVPSGYLVDVFREFGLQAQVAPNIVDLSQFSYRIRQPLRPHLVCTRGFHPYYCIDDVVRAFAEVQRTFPDARLDLVGKGPTQAQIEKLLDKLGVSGVHFCGVASREEIGRFYDHADIFINASKLDNMPVSVLEAFASGTPVASTMPEGMDYIVEHERTGLLSKVGDSHELAQNVIRLLRDPELASRLSANAYEETPRYRWEVVRRQWLDIYHSLRAEKTQVGRELISA